MDKKIIKVLMLIPSLGVADGVASFAMNYFKCVDHSNVHIDFAVFSDSISPHYYDDIVKLGSKVFILHSPRFLVRHIKECKRILQGDKYDVIHDNTLLKSLPLMILAKKCIPVRILHSHNSKFAETFLKSIRNRLFYPLLKATATNYAACSDVAGKACFGQSEYKIIANIIDRNLFCFNPKIRTRVRKENNACDKIIIGSVGRLAKQKNPFFAISVIAQLIKQNNKIEYWWIGDGPLFQTIKNRIDELGLQNRIKCLGTRTDIRELYQGMDLFFMPSVFEGLPIALIEAQAMGLPCVISDIISKEATYTDLVTHISLKKQKNTWVSAILEQLSQKHDRVLPENTVKNCVFFSTNAGKLLEAFYTSLIK